jgi:uracil-DNA glycosylase
MPNIKIVLVGEAYEASEEEFKHPFVGAAGVELARMLAKAKIASLPRAKFPSQLDMILHWKNLKNNEGIYVTNVFNQRPDNNDVMEFFTNKDEGDTTLPAIKNGSSRGYLRPEFKFELDRLISEINELKPNLIVCLGNTAVWAVMLQNGITDLRGAVAMSPVFSIKCLPTIHPATVLYPGGWGHRPTIIADLNKAKQEAEFPEIRRIKRWILAEPTLDEIENWLNEPAEAYSVDIESGRALYTKLEMKRVSGAFAHLMNSSISMIGFARDPNHALVIPFLTRKKLHLHYWEKEEDEISAWKLAQFGLEKLIPKIFQNGLYDIPMLINHNMRPRMCNEDTMILHHALYPELPKSLGYLGSLYSNEISWKMMYSNAESFKRGD